MLSKRSLSRRSYIIDSVYMVSRLGKSTETESRSVVASGWERGVIGNRRLFEGGWKTMDPYPSSTWFCTSTGAEDGESINFQFLLVIPALSGMTSGVSTHYVMLLSDWNTAVLSLTHSTPCLPNTCCALTCCLHKTEHPHEAFSIRGPRLSYGHGPQWSAQWPLMPLSAFPAPVHRTSTSPFCFLASSLLIMFLRPKDTVFYIDDFFVSVFLFAPSDFQHLSN